MKKLLSVILASFLLLSATACGGTTAPVASSSEVASTVSSTSSEAASSEASSSEPEPQSSEEAEFVTVEEVKGHVIAMCNSPLTKEEILETTKTKQGVDLKDIIFAPGVGELVMLIKNGQTDAAFLYMECTADYIISKNADLMKKNIPVMQDVSMVIKEDNIELLDEINSAITELDKTGILTEQKKVWIDNFDQSTVEIKKVPVLEGQPTVKVGISGYAYPLDYVTADGEAAGFNVAMMSEISRVINRNIEFVVIPNESIFMALESGKIDVFFWLLSDHMLPEGLARTTPYHAEYSSVLFKK